MPGNERNPNASSVSTVADLIQLPRFDAAGAVEMGEALIAVASDVAELPRSIKRAKEALEEDLSTLRAAASARLAAAAASDPAATAAADRALDACWTALHDWLAAFTKLPEGFVEQAEARALLAEIYPDGLSFILLPFEAEWDQSESRVLRLTGHVGGHAGGDAPPPGAGEPLGDRVRALGGGVFIDALGAAHATYGKVLGLPREKGKRGGGASGVADALDGFVAALRVYALKVTAYVELDEPLTAELAVSLLDPLLNYQVRSGDQARGGRLSR